MMQTTVVKSLKLGLRFIGVLVVILALATVSYLRTHNDISNVDSSGKLPRARARMSRPRDRMYSGDLDPASRIENASGTRPSDQTTSASQMSTTEVYEEESNGSRVGKRVLQSHLNSKLKRESSLKETRHIGFLKVHKTGSSSVQNVLIRFGESRNLTFLLGSVKHTECGRGNFHCISYNDTIHDGNITPPPANKSFDLLCSHVVYNKESFQHYLPSDTKYISIIREPTRRLESAISFFELDEFIGGSMSTFAKSPTSYYHAMVNNRMAFEFGFNKNWFPNTTHKLLSTAEKAEVTGYIDDLINDFDLIMINEQMDESLVLMKRMFRWELKDIVYQSKLVRRHSGFDEEDEPKIKDYLYLDYLLYDRAVKTLKAKIRATEAGFREEVVAFQRLNDIVNGICESNVIKTKDVAVKKTEWYGEFDVTRKMCEALKLIEPLYLLKMRVRQYGPLYKKDKRLKRAMGH